MPGTVLRALPSHQGQRLPPWQGQAGTWQGHLGQRHGGVSAGGAKGALSRAGSQGGSGQGCEGPEQSPHPTPGPAPELSPVQVKSGSHEIHQGGSCPLTSFPLAAKIEAVK